MNFDIIQAHLQSALDLADKPDIVGFQYRKLSLIYFFKCQRGEFVLKLPKKSRMRVRDIREIQPKEKYQSKARIEWESLNVLFNQFADGDCPVDFVEPVAFIENLPGVVIKRIQGEDFYTGSLPRTSEGAIRFNGEVLQRVGSAFHFLHERNRATPQAYRVPGIGHVSARDGGLRSWNSRIAGFLGDRNLPAGLVMSGFSLTDVMVSRPDRRVWFLDPGRLEEEILLRDLARFVVELRKIASGWPGPGRRKRIASYEGAFLDGYREAGGEVESTLMGVFILLRLIEDLQKFRRKADAKRWRSGLAKLSGLRHFTEAFYRREIQGVIDDYRLRSI